MIQPLWRTLQRILKKLKLVQLYDPAIPLLGICPEKTIIQKDTFTPMYIAALFTKYPVHGSNLNAHEKRT